MADTVIQDRQLRLVLEAGVDEKGNPTFKSKNFNNIKLTAAADALLDVAEAIAGLQTLTLVQVEQNDSHLLSRN
jgi:predicted transport protein